MALLIIVGTGYTPDAGVIKAQLEHMDNLEITVVGNNKDYDFADEISKRIEQSIIELRNIEIPYWEPEVLHNYPKINRCIGKPIKIKCRITHHRIRHATHAQCKYYWRAKKQKKYRG